MKRFFDVGIFAAFLGLVLVAGNLHAHSALTSSTPNNSQVLGEVEQLQLGFNEPVRLLRLRLVAEDDSEVSFGFAPNATPQPEFAFDLPDLPESRYTVYWTVIGTDGHTVNNSFEFTVDASAPASAGEGHHDHHHHHH